MKKIAIKARQSLPHQVLKDADEEPVMLVLGGKPRYLIQSLKQTRRSRLKKADTSEDRDWVAYASSHILSAYGDEDCIYDELYG